MSEPRPVIAALRDSHERLAADVARLEPAEYERASYASEWSIAQVLSHLGSQAEIFSKILDAGLSGGDPPGREAFEPIWAVWNAKSPSEQVADALAANAAFVARLEALDDAELASFHVAMFGMDLDAARLATMRLSELALHAWDVAAALDDQASLAPDAVDILVDEIHATAARSGKPSDKAKVVTVVTSAPQRRFALDTGAVKLEPAAASGPDSDAPVIQLPAEALIRLVYGRLDGAHLPPTVEVEGIELEELRQVFPGF